jgi:CRISPR-associated protein Cas5a/b/c
MQRFARNRAGSIIGGPLSTPITSHVEREIARQPSAWRAALDRLDTHAAALPPAGSRVAVVGCGTSLYMARAYAACREAAGHGETDAFPASEYRYGRKYDHVVALSRSGTTTEVLQVLDSLGGTAANTATTAVTVDAALPIAGLARHTIALPMAMEESVVQTVFPTTALAVLRASVGESLDRALSGADDAVAGALPLDPDAVSQITFVGTGWASAIAEEAALKCREAAGFWTEAYPTMEYRHGPISVSGPGTAVWAFGIEPAGFATDAIATGATYVHRDDDPMVDLIRAQRTAVALARRTGRDPDRPRSLSFSVVLDDSGS